MSTAFDHLEDDGGILFHVDPRDKDPRSEEQRQLAFLRDARMLCPGVILFAVPNAGRRTSWEIGKAKREGLRKGCCDIVAVWPGGVAFMEFKAADTMPTPAQRAFLNSIHAAGHHCGVFRSAETALRALKAWGAPFVGWYS